MFRVTLIVVGLGIALLGGAFLYLGAFPPDPPTREISRTLPNDRFQGR